MTKSEFHFPVGYHVFHQKPAFSYQLNRYHSMGVARYEDMLEVGQNISSIQDWRTEMERVAEISVAEGRLMNAAMYFRAAEFYLQRTDPDKQQLYDRFAELFEMATKDDGIERFDVPFGEAYLPAIRMAPRCSDDRGTIVVHGGNDSFIEEFYPLLRYFSESGYQVVAFEGPGQGGALKKYGLVLAHEWEKPTSAVLDYFELDDVTLLGISMGGWLSLRAAACEPRVKRVIAWSVSFDVLQYTNAVGQIIARLMFRRLRSFVTSAIVKKMKKDLEYSWFVNNLMYITGQESPIEAFDMLFRFNEENLRAQDVTQDVLILTGRDDHLVPFKMHAKQVAALTHARSVTSRIFTQEDQAGSHCQMGNIGLTLEVMNDWILDKL